MKIEMYMIYDALIYFLFASLGVLGIVLSVYIPKFFKIFKQNSIGRSRKKD